MKEIPLKDAPFGATVLWKDRQWVARPASEKPDETRRRLFEVGGTATVLPLQETTVELVLSTN